MGIDARIEAELETCVAELLDPHNRLNWLLRLAILDSTRCLQFIDPYGDTVFNRLQIPVLQSECFGLASRLTEPNLREGKRVYLEHAAAWPKVALEDARKGMEALSLGELRHHLDALLQLLSEAAVKEPNHYVRFIGD
jgi:hypothetical protein